MKITVLTENTAKNENFKCEHGLSLYIETNGKKILFDAGQSDIFLKNSKTLGIDLGTADLCILSHGHYDHGGGLKYFLEINNNAPIYINEHAFEPHYNGKGKYIGLNPVLKESKRLVITNDICKIDGNMTLYTCNEKTLSYPIEPYGLTCIKNHEKSPEDFRHEQYLLINENGRKILISGCSHKGIVNIAEIFNPDILVGGFHFKDIEPNEQGKEILKEKAQLLLKEKTTYYICHCTGILQFDYLKEIMGNRVKYISAGTEINI